MGFKDTDNKEYKSKVLIKGDRWLLKRTIGKGAFGKVFLLEHESQRNEVRALKVIDLLQ